MSQDQFSILLKGWRLGTLSTQENQKFIQLVRSGMYDDQIGDAMETDLELGWIKGASTLQQQEEDLAWIKSKMLKSISPVHRVHFLRTAWFRVAVAILIILGVGTYLWNQHSSRTVAVATKTVPVENDVLPGGNRATLKLADGSVIMLDSAVSGKLTQQAGAVIEKSTNGEIVYSFDQTSLNNNVVYNIMSTPRGGTYQLILPDGSKVWLNAESSITFPTVFIGNRREVKMTGEVYFEIKPIKEKPFIVDCPKGKITVLGTSFNVNMYTDEPLSKTSLIDGSIKIDEHILRPGQAYANGKVMATNLEQDLAWKNGAFNFYNMDTEAAFRQLGRWYNVNVRFAGKVPSKLGGKIGRDLNLSQVLIALEDVGIRTRLEGNTLVVLPE